MKTYVIIAALVVTVVGAILLLLLTSASANTALFAHNYPLLMGLNAVVVIALLLLVIVQLLALRREHRNGVFGARLKSRLLAILALMAVLPGVLVYAVSMQFVMNSIESWFDVRVDSALEGGLDLARNVLDGQLAELTGQARNMALELGDSGAMQSTRLNRLREQSGAQTATLFSASGRVLASSSTDFGKLLPDMPSSAQLRQGRQGRGLALIEGEAISGLTLRVLVPVTSDAITLESNILQVTRQVSPLIGKNAASVEAAYREYQELSLGRQGLNRIYTLTLTLTLLLALFAATALAIFLSRRLAAPLLILAEGTQAVAAGDFTPRAALETNDELGVLTQSFNRMTRQLFDARQETERHRSEVETARTYLEGVLANLSSGVLAFDRNFVLRANNRGACAILNDPLDTSVDGLPLDQWPSHTVLKEAIRNGFTDSTVAETPGGEWESQINIDHGNNANDIPPQVLLLRGSTLPEVSGGGYVVVFDDITGLIAAQRAAAWGEVARRLAHEIKNPLTPIQLSAERLQQKLANKLDPDAQALLKRSTETIVNQVEAMKNMVNDFRDYGRSPSAQLQPLDLNALITEVLILYETARVRVTADLADDLPLISGDASQLRQVIHNLLTNAEEVVEEAGKTAESGNTEHPEIRIATHRGTRGGVLLVVSDTGGGFPAQILAHAFEPYVTTKARGSGLGLAIVRKIVDEHHGEIHIANRSPHGAEVTIKLPQAA